MSSTVDWADELSSEFQTEKYGSKAMTTSSEWTYTMPSSLLAIKTLIALVGYLGTVTNGLVLAGFWFSDRSKMTSSMIHIINHTTLELSDFYIHHFLDLHYWPSFFCMYPGNMLTSTISWTCCSLSFSWPTGDIITYSLRPLSYLLAWCLQRSLQWR